MTPSIRSLLAQIATFEAQNRAGLTPLPGELVTFFETAKLASQDVRSFDSGMPVPGERPATQGMTSAPLALDRVDGQVVELTARVALPVMARAVLDQLTIHDERRLVREAAPARA